MHHNRRIKIIEFLLEQDYITEKQALKVIEEQKKTGRDVSSIIVDMGYITDKELTSLLGEQIQIVNKKRLGEVLIDHALITPEQLKEALQKQKVTHDTIGESLIKLGYIDEETLLDVLGAQLDTPHVVLDNIVFNQKMLDLIPISYMEQYMVIPLFIRHNELTVAMADPNNLRTRDHLRFTTGKEIAPVIASEASIKQFIKKLKNNEVKSVSKSLDVLDTVEIEEQISEDDLAASEYGEVVVNIVNNLIFDAIADGASDIHIESYYDVIKVRFRIDGVLVERRELDFRYLAPIVSRLKILSNLDISEKRIPQDGKFHIIHNKNQVDIRVSTFPIVSRDRGVTEKIVLRILDTKSGSFALDDIAFTREVKEQYQKLIHLPNGLILITGPTGSGKSTTLYSTLKERMEVGVNIITMEDPVEYTIEGISQGQIAPKSGFDFSSGMRSVLRQDPDIIMIGEIRDKETSQMAVHAALTGHLVFSTLHTNDAPSAITRLIDMGLEPYLITSAIKGIMAQRLVRKICPHCKEEYETPEDIITKFEYPLPLRLSRGSGCKKCNFTGYKGRIPIFELLVPDENIRHMIMSKESSTKIKQYAYEEGLLTTLRMNGFTLVSEGVTTIDEVLMKSESDFDVVR